MDSRQNRSSTLAAATTAAGTKCQALRMHRTREKWKEKEREKEKFEKRTMSGGGD